MREDGDLAISSACCATVGATGKTTFQVAAEEPAFVNFTV